MLCYGSVALAAVTTWLVGKEGVVSCGAPWLSGPSKPLQLNPRHSGTAGAQLNSARKRRAPTRARTHRHVALLNDPHHPRITNTRDVYTAVLHPAAVWRTLPLASLGPSAFLLRPAAFRSAPLRPAFRSAALRSAAFRCVPMHPAAPAVFHCAALRSAASRVPLRNAFRCAPLRPSGAPPVLRTPAKRLLVPDT